MRPQLLFAFLLLYGCHEAIRYPGDGLPYPARPPAADTNFYAYPYRDSMDTEDSLDWIDVAESYRMFREPNLSLRPPKTPVFRMFILGGVSEAVVSVFPDRIVVKENVGEATSYPYSDYYHLTDPIEQEQFATMDLYFPYSGNYFYEHEPRRRRQVDSMLQRYPQLHDPAYYQQLKVKARVDKSRTFRFTERVVPIGAATYRRLIDALRDSGYWRLPFRVEPGGAGADGGAVLAEWSGPERYKMLHLLTLGNPEIPAARVFQEILDLGGVSARHHIWTDPKTIAPQKEITVEPVELAPMSEEEPPTERGK